jgi:hypothetical protein
MLRTWDGESSPSGLPPCVHVDPSILDRSSTSSHPSSQLFVVLLAIGSASEPAGRRRKGQTSNKWIQDNNGEYAQVGGGEPNLNTKHLLDKHPMSRINRPMNASLWLSHLRIGADRARNSSWSGQRRSPLCWAHRRLPCKARNACPRARPSDDPQPLGEVEEAMLVASSKPLITVRSASSISAPG